MIATVETAIKKNLLDPEKHGVLVQDLESIILTANITKTMFFTSMREFCSQAECNWISTVSSLLQGGGGALYQGKFLPPPETRMMAMAAVCLRNFIDARVWVLQSFIEEMDEEPSVVLIPDFCIDSGTIPSWQVQNVYSRLVKRMVQGKVTVLYAISRKRVIEVYGNSMDNHLTSEYFIIEGRA